jgi:hypothetical protein
VNAELTPSFVDRYKYTRGMEAAAKRQHIRRDNPALPWAMGVILELLGCRSSTCGFGRVLAFLVFYSSFGSQITAQYKS